MSVRRSDLCRQMDRLMGACRVVPLAEVIRAATAPGPETGTVAAVTFDDGYRGNAEVAHAVLSERGLPYTIFVTTGPVLDGKALWFDRVLDATCKGPPKAVEIRVPGVGRARLRSEQSATQRWKIVQAVLEALKRMDPHARSAAVEELCRQSLSGSGRDRLYLSVGELQELARSPLVTVGAHTHGHEILDRVDGECARHSIALSRELLASWTGRVIDLLAYPNGGHSDRVVGIVKDLGFSGACTVRNGVMVKGISPFRVPRVGIGGFDGVEGFRTKVGRFVEMP